MFNNASIKVKIIAVCGLLATFTCISGAVSFITEQRVSAQYERVTNINFPNSENLADMAAEFKNARIHLRTLGLSGATREMKGKAVADAKQSIMRYEERAKTYLTVDYLPGEKELYDALDAAWKNFLEVGGRVLAIAEANPHDATAQLEKIYQKDCPEAAARFEKAFDALTVFHDDIAKRDINSAKETQLVGQITVICLALVSFVLAMVIAYFFSRNLANTLNALAERLADGAAQVATASGKISEAGADLSSSTTEQAAALQQTVASIDEVSAMVSKNADNAKRSQAVAESSQQAAVRGKRDMDQMQRSIDEINQSNNDIMRQTESSNQDIANIVKVIGEIGNKTKVINDIVFQTKLLSFNASVEAARAGEHGKGFAVVAEEVGNLAQMSGNAAKEISQMLEDSIRKVESTVNESKSKIERLIVASKDKVDAGMTTARRCGDALEEIVKNVSDLNHMVVEISTASQEQAQGVQEINKAMGQLDQVTQQNAAGAQQSATASSSLNAQAAVLHGLVATLVTTVQGSNGRARVAPPAAVPVASPAPVAPTAETSSVPSGQVLSFHRNQVSAAPKPNVKPVSRVTAQKVAVGGDAAMPAEDDARFEDI